MLTHDDILTELQRLDDKIIRLYISESLTVDNAKQCAVLTSDSVWAEFLIEDWKFGGSLIDLVEHELQQVVDNIKIYRERVDADT
jgi:hypothetical protein